MTAPSALHDLLTSCFDSQNEATAQWHDHEPDVVPLPDAEATASPQTLQAWVLAQHSCNFRLWHVEDIARRKDVGPEVIADCKYRIDGLNQQRNDRMERVDACLMALLTPCLPEQSSSAINTESLGMAIDRMSILSLKIWHMREQLDRSDVTPEHIASCQKKWDVLLEQRSDLATAIHQLIDDYGAGTRRPKVYFQFKMYNDATLNPQLYGKERS